MKKNLLLVALAASTVLLTTHAEARAGRGGFSRPSIGFKSAPKPAPSQGVTRPSVVQQARSNQAPAAAPAVPAPAPAPVVSQARPAPAPIAPAAPAYPVGAGSSGYSGTAMAGAAVAGGVLGYMMGSSSSNSAHAATPAAAESKPPVSPYREPLPAEAEPASTSMVPWLLGIGALGLLGFGAYVALSGSSQAPRRMPGQNSAARPLAGAHPTARSPVSSLDDMDSAVDSLLGQADPLFRSMQDAYSRKDLAHLRNIATPEFAQILTEQLNEDVPKTTVASVEVVGNRVLEPVRENGQKLASIHYRATVCEDDGPPETFEEVWHFVQPEGSLTWLIAGIEVLETT